MLKDSKWKRQLVIIENTSGWPETYLEPSETSKMESSAKIVDWIQPLTIFSKHFILDVWQGYVYASDQAKQNPGPLSLIPQKIRIAISPNFLHF